ncbi:MAG: DUF4339 domain-containing protein [Solobacterium sp.]|nr:DUF4339 domain-containing protein [Solobacterium sp.]
MDRVWYYMKQDRSKWGPYTDAELVSLIKQEILSDRDWIWMPDMEKWLRVANSIYAFYLPEQA